MIETKILIVDDHPVLREGLALYLNSHKEFKVVGESDNTFDAVEKISKLEPDIAIVDLMLGKSSGLDLIKEVRTRYPSVLILVLSMFEEKDYAERALRAGAKAYVMKADAAEKILVAIKQIKLGHIYLSDKMRSEILETYLYSSESYNKAENKLTDRELEVYRLIGEGLKTKKIAERLNISSKTVESHRMHIKKKLEISNSTELIQSAYDWVKKHKKII